MDYKWNVLNKCNSLSEVLSSIVNYKNMDKTQIMDFMNCAIKPHNPFLLSNMEKAVKRLNFAKENREKILIVGDYDCDGVTSIIVLYIALRHMGFDVIWEVPDRFKDGYGLNNRLIDIAIENNCKLILTADNGIAAHDQIKYANSFNIDVIVTDHHELLKEDLPTDITIDPKIDDSYPFKGICGCMVAFKLLNALYPDLQNEKELYEELLSFATIGTIADVMDLVDENRYYVKLGLTCIENTKNIGLQYLLMEMKLYKKKLTAIDVAFSIGPAINVAGRLESPKIAINLFLSDDPVECQKLAKQLIELNKTRKSIQEDVVNNLKVDENDNFIIVNSNIGHGIVGIIAGKISEKYQRPCFVLGEHKGKLSGSGRSILDYDISDIIVKNPDIVSGGGHAAACGVSIEAENLDLLKRICNEHFLNWKESKKGIDLTPTIDIISQINFNIIDKKLISSINRLQPFGQGNPEPLFLTKNVFVSKYKVVGENKNAIQFTFDDDTNILNGIGFNNNKDTYMDLGTPKYIDIVYSIGLNEWPQGTFNIQLVIKDIRKSEEE